MFEKGALAVDGTRVRLEKIRCPGGWRTSTESIERLVELYAATNRPERGKEWREKIPPKRAPQPREVVPK